MPLDQGYLAQNVRRLAGLHLVSLDALAREIGISRQSMTAMVAYDPTRRSVPKAETAIRIAEQFAVPLEALYEEFDVCLQEALERVHEAPVVKIAKVPTVGQLMKVAREEGVPVVVHMPRKRRGGRSKKRQ
jgi:DNA-binding XRE family transcriptional regulator